MIITILPQYFGVKKKHLASLVLKFQLMGRLNHPLKMLTLELKSTKLEKKHSIKYTLHNHILFSILDNYRNDLIL